MDTFVGPLYMEAGDPCMPRYIGHFGIWEPGETALLEEYLEPGMVVVDVGAHTGYFSILCGRLVGADGLVVAFEPDPRNYELLLANVWAHGLTNVVCLPWAVSDPVDSASFISLPRTRMTTVCTPPTSTAAPWVCAPSPSIACPSSGRPSTS